MANTIKSRILLKTDTMINWDKAANSFIPKPGEICIYLDRIQLDDGTYIPGIKVGDGMSYINELEFMSEDYISNEEIDSLFAKIIKFYIGNTEHTCEEGMTWEVFVNSKYNKDRKFEFSISSSESEIIYGEGNSPVKIGSMGVFISDLIIPNQIYSLGSAEPE